MMMDLVLSYFLMNNEPMYLFEPTSESYTAELKLNIHHDMNDYSYIDLSPYAMRNIREGVTGRAGAEADIGIWIGDVALELYHHSSHNLDHISPDPGKGAIEMDAIRLKWKLR